MQILVKFRNIRLLFALIFAACLGPTVGQSVTAAPVRIACVGDSITWGYTITHDRLARAWPGVLQKLVGKKYKSEDFGHNGATLLKKGNLPYWTTPEFKGATKFDPNIVIIMLGTNDTKPQNWKKYGSVARLIICPCTCTTGMRMALAARLMAGITP